MSQDLKEMRELLKNCESGVDDYYEGDLCSWVIDAFGGTPERIERLVATIYKMSKWSGVDVSELIEEGYLEEGDA